MIHLGIAKPNGISGLTALPSRRADAFISLTHPQLRSAGSVDNLLFAEPPQQSRRGSLRRPPPVSSLNYKIMKISSVLLTALLLAAGSATAQHTPDYGQAATLKIWDNATAPHSNGITSPETEPRKNRPANTSEAVLYIFPADETLATGQAVVICPGGGYGGLAIDHEGYEMGRWFAANGVTAAVLKYRLPNHHPEVPLEDAVQALRIMSGLEAGATGYTAEKVGIVGFSAGGHLAAMTSTMGTTRPAFSILFYPVITAAAKTGHQGSFDNLLGDKRKVETDAYYSLHNRVTEATPPTLLLLSDDDRAVPPLNSTLYYNALKEHGIEASMHIYPTGGHGWGFHDDFAYKAQWQQAVLDWLRKINQ